MRKKKLTVKPYTGKLHQTGAGEEIDLKATELTPVSVYGHLHADPSLTPYTEEEQELCDAAVRAVLATVRTARNAGKYAPYEWLNGSEYEHVQHAFGHARELQNKYEGFRMRMPDEDHAAHLITRGVLLLALAHRNSGAHPGRCAKGATPSNEG